ncbi:MAG: DNA-binding protein [Candidatus Margulisbacteria bacterium]|nr:DNA-binding protein [Candidatus Margulisiibacteriota bacterium]
MKIIYSLLLIGSLLIVNSPAHGVTVSCNQLVNNAPAFDNQKVEVIGEVIGDIMVRGDYAWININGGLRSIGVWATKNMLNDIKLIGDYNHIGDRVKVTGTFHRACPEHGGDLDIHAETITIAQTGYKVEHPIDGWKLSLAMILLAITLGVYLLFVLLKRFKP